MSADIRTHPELQTFARTAELISLMSSPSKLRTAATSTSAAAHGPVPEGNWLGHKQKSKQEEGEKEKEGLTRTSKVVLEESLGVLTSSFSDPAIVDAMSEFSHKQVCCAVARQISF